MNNFTCLQKQRTIKKGSKSKYGYIDTVCTLDTETSKRVYYNQDGTMSANSYAWVYSWAIYIQDEPFFGRTVLELVDCIEKIAEILEVTDQDRLKIYVHNLGYDFTFIARFMCERFGLCEVFSDEPHKLFKATFPNGIELVDSYRLFNSSLDKVCKDYKIPTESSKLHGFDYNKVRQSYDKLTDFEIQYQINDVKSLYLALHKYMELNNKNIANIPLTQTGLVRSIAFKKYSQYNREHYNKYRHDFQKSKYDVDTYDHLLRCMAGGLTHGNRAYSGKLVVAYENDNLLKRYKKLYPNAIFIKGKIKHYDFASDYPSQDIINRFPSFSYKIGDNVTWNEFYKNKKDEYFYSYSFDLYFPSGIEVKDNITCPYMQIYKVKTEHVSHVIHNDNGRLLALKEPFTFSCSEEELKVFMKQYNFIETPIIMSVYEHKLTKLPPYIIDTINEYYKNKSDYKNKVNELKSNQASIEEIEDAERRLMISKQILNSIFGMSATQYEHENYTWEYGKYIASEKEPLQEVLDKYYSNNKNFMRFGYGCYTTMYARLELLYFMDVIESNGGIYLYSDTDSIFFVDTITDDCEKKIAEINQKFRYINDKEGYYIESNGKRIYYNQFEKENENIKAFKFLHSKCYAYDYIATNKTKTVDKIKHSITIAGVSGSSIDKYKELGNIDNLEVGKKFYKCGGTCSQYFTHDISKDEYGEIYADSVIITDRVYTLKDQLMDDEYTITPLKGVIIDY